jgi:hypothetical protein
VISRVRLSLAAAAAAVVLVAGGCASAGGSATGAPAGSRQPVPTVAAAGCDAGNLAGWPKPGQVTTSGIIPVLASSERLVGKSRLLFVLVDQQNQPIANEALRVEMGFYDLCADPATATEVVTPAFEWGIVGARAFYVATPELTSAGPWGVAVAVQDPANGTTVGAKLQFTVAERGSGPRVGDPAPAAKTLTLADVGGDVRKVSSDPTPEPSFYETSLDAALAAKQPFVLAFITPAFCTSGECGPTMETLKKAVKDAPIRVVAVEPYQLAWQNDRLQPVSDNNGFVPVEATNTYGIPTEPWIFVVDASGTISASFEAVVGEQELADAIRAVTK